MKDDEKLLTTWEHTKNFLLKYKKGDCAQFGTEHYTCQIKIQLKKNRMHVGWEDIEILLMNMVLKTKFSKDTNPKWHLSITLYLIG